MCGQWANQNSKLGTTCCSYLGCFLQPERRRSAGPARCRPPCSPGMLITPSPVLPALLPGRGERRGAAGDKASRERIRTPRRSGLAASSCPRKQMQHPEPHC
uniref:Uncharacterized protein n=1 Tax=Junco hyemalis TaxID=40217 RepID=A0A8C5ITC6_JUNHY